MANIMNNKAKKTLAVLVASLCLLSQSWAGQTVEASFKIPVSATIQNKMAAEGIKMSRLKVDNSARAQSLLPKAVALQKRIMDYNGLEMVDGPLQHTHDYKTKIRPVVLANIPDWGGLSVGAGRIFVDTRYFRCCDIADEEDVNHYDIAVAQQVIAHEMTHSITGGSLPRMGLFVAFRLGHEKRKEEISAERGSVKLLEQVPEGGWGSYVLSYMRVPSTDDVYQRATNHVLDDFEKNTKKRMMFNRVGKKRKEGGNIVSYLAADGNKYRIEGGWRKAAHHEKDDATCYLGGQIAECIAADAFHPNNLRIMSVSELPGVARFAGDCMLVCTSSKLPHGWKALASLYDISKSDAQAQLDDLRRNFAKAPCLSKTDGYEKWLQEVNKGSLSNQGSRYLLAEVMALAYDNSVRKD